MIYPKVENKNVIHQKMVGKWFS